MAKTEDAVPQYEQRLVLFLDILGFQEIVDRTVGDPKALLAVLNAIDSISQMRTKEIHETKQVSQFSDSIVVSFAISQESAVFSLVNEVALTIIWLAEQGFLLRGGVTVGLMMHTDDYAIGPAFVRAYRMESEESKYPRVIFDEEIFAIAWRYHADRHTPEQEERFVRDLLSQDVDGKFYFDFVSWNSVVAQAGGEPSLYAEYLFRIGEMAAERLRHDDASVIHKGKWLLERYLVAVDEASRMCTHPQFQEENVELCSSVQSFPRYDEIAQEAEQRLNNAAKG